jgi:hypothetical protein
MRTTPIDPGRGHAIATGIFFLTAAGFAVAGAVAYQPLLGHADYVMGAGADTRILLGALCEIVLVASVIGTGVASYPIVKRQNESVALGYVCGRLLEAAIIAVGIVSVLSVVTLRQHQASAPATAASAAGGADQLAALASALVAVHDWTFLVGPGLVIGVNSFLLAWLVFRAALVPRPIALLGLIGGPLLFASSTAVLFGAYAQVSGWAGLCALPVTAWELSLAVWLLVKGFAPASDPARAVSAPPAGQALSAA